MSRDEIIEIEKEHLASVYSKRDIVAVKGKDALIWDINGTSTA
jgi:acetylornithine/succinyldiaminopimelate/putrescine aminotransferase